MNPGKLMVMRWLKSQGLQQKEIADLLQMAGHQNVGYHFRNLRSAFFDKQESTDSQWAGVVPLLVGYVSDLCPPSLECPQCNGSSGDQNHNCPRYVQSAAYAQMEDLTKEQKIGVILALLAEVEAE